MVVYNFIQTKSYTGKEVEIFAKEHKQIETNNFAMMLDLSLLNVEYIDLKLKGKVDSIARFTKHLDVYNGKFGDYQKL